MVVVKLRILSYMTKRKPKEEENTYNHTRDVLKERSFVCPQRRKLQATKQMLAHSLQFIFQPTRKAFISSVGGM